MSKRKDDSPGPQIENRRARFDYEIIETLEVGIALRGSEVKSIRNGRASLAEGYVRATSAPPSLVLHSMSIDEYGPGGPLGGVGQHKMTRARPLLAHRREILKLARQTEAKGMTIVPLKLYFKRGWAKVLIGLARGRSKHDKRRAIGEREAKREITRAMSRRREG